MEENNQGTDLRLIRKIREDSDAKAQETLIRKYIPMVKHIVRTQTHYLIEPEDLVQEGLIGLLKAIREYKPENYPVKFSTFAYICIIRRIYNTLKLWQSKKYRIHSSALSMQLTVNNNDESRCIMDTLEQPNANPQEIVEEIWINSRLDQVLQAYLSPVEMAVIKLYLQGLTSSDIQKTLCLNAKVVDNARTRVRQKLGRIVEKYGSLHSAGIPLKTRKREDLSIPLQSYG